jgi:hypothetical protein
MNTKEDAPREDKTVKLASKSPATPQGAGSRRWLLRGGVAGAAGLSLAGGALAVSHFVHPGTAATQADSTATAQATAARLKEFFSILATGEALAQTFYSNGIAHFEALRLDAASLTALVAIRNEEQLHFNLAIAQGGVPATTHFSFPSGPNTFTNRALFFATQQQIEDLTNGALLAFINDTAAMGLTRLAQLGGQLMQVEGGHRALGRAIWGVLTAQPFANWGFGPVTVAHFTDVPAHVKAAGFLNPKAGNDFAFTQVNPSLPGLVFTSPGNL